MMCPYCQGSANLYWRGVFEWWECQRCRLLFRFPAPTDEQLQDLYANSWTDPNAHRAETGGTTAPLAITYAKRLLKNLGRKDFRGLKILDFAAGRGDMAAALESLGAEAYALDPYGREHLLARGLRAFSSTSDMPVGLRFDGITSIDAIEHIPKPWHDLRTMRDLLARDGWLFVSTANARGAAARISRSRWREANKAGHVVLFTAPGLRQMLRTSGFSPVVRVYWRVRYSKNAVRRLVHYFLQSTGFDGELRFLAFNRH